MKRFFAMEKQLQPKIMLRVKHLQLINEYEDIEHMAPCDESSQVSSDIIPRHVVFNTNNLPGLQKWKK